MPLANQELEITNVLSQLLLVVLLFIKDIVINDYIDFMKFLYKREISTNLYAVSVLKACTHSVRPEKWHPFLGLRRQL